MAYESMCPTHRLQVIQDKIVLSRAWASLPPMLQIFRLNDVNQFSQGKVTTIILSTVLCIIE